MKWPFFVFELHIGSAVSANGITRFPSWFYCFFVFFCCFHFLQKLLRIHIEIDNYFARVQCCWYMKRTLKVTTIKTSGWPKEQFLYQYLDKRKHLTRNLTSFKPAVTEELSLNRLREREAKYFCFIWLTCVNYCVALCHPWSFSRQKLMSGQEGSSSDYQFIIILANPYLSQLMKKGSRVSFHVSFFLIVLQLMVCRLATLQVQKWLVLLFSGWSGFLAFH